MKSNRGIGSYGLFFWKTTLIVLLVTGTGIPATRTSASDTTSTDSAV